MAKYHSWKSWVISVTTIIAFDLVPCEDQNKTHHLPILYYDFEYMTESRVFDRRGSKSFAQMNNESILETTGKCQNGISLNSRPLRVTGLRTADSITVAAWVRLKESQENMDRTIITRLHNATDSSNSKQWWYFGIDGNDKKLRWRFNSTRCKSFSPNSTLKHGVWQHVAVVHNFTNGFESCKFFVNGNKAMGKKTDGSGFKTSPSDYVFLIGSADDEGHKPLNGSMDEFYIYNETLSEKEIENIKNFKCQEDPTSSSTEFQATETTTHLVPTTTTKMVPTTTEMIPTTTKMDLLQARLKYISSSKDEENSAIKFTKEIEDNLLSQAWNTLKLNQSRILETPSALLFIKIPVSGFTFPSVRQQSLKNITESISFPDDLVKTKSGVQRAFACIAYSNLHEDMDREFTISSGSFQGKTLKLNSKIIGAGVDPPITESLRNRITITFIHAQKFSGKQICSFWNHSIRTANASYGQWSTQGCELDEQKSLSNKTVCLCNHLTNFALLLVSNEEPPLSLTIITIIGCSLSILGCVVCFIMFFTLKNKYIRHYLHINLTFAIAVAQLILLFGISQTKYKILCKAMAACLHYFFLVAFFLMLCEGVHLAILIETAFSSGELKLPFYLIASWGLPLMIVGVTLGTRYDNYGNHVACVISAAEGTVYAFVGPFALILLINTFILVIVLRQVISKTSLPISSQAASKFQIAKATVRSLVMLFPVMGFTWIFGILFFGFRTLALEYLFAIFCSLQGFFIFLFQYALNTESRLAFVRATQRLRLTLTSSFTSTGHNSMKQDNIPTVKISSPDEQRENANTSSQDNCHLIVYRPVDDKSGTMIDSGTASTFL